MAERSNALVSNQDFIAKLDFCDALQKLRLLPGSSKKSLRACQKKGRYLKIALNRLKFESKPDPKGFVGSNPALRVHHEDIKRTQKSELNSTRTT